MKARARRAGMLFGRMPIRPRELLKVLVSEIPGKASKEGDTEWTRATKEALYELGKKKGFVVYASLRLKKEMLHEWMLDVVWYSARRGSVRLAVESELGNEGNVCDDFEKLMCIKSPLKLLLVESGRKTLVGKLEDYLAEFDQHVRGETYLLVDFHDGQHESYKLVAKRDGKLRRGESNFSRMPALCGPDIPEQAMPRFERPASARANERVSVPPRKPWNVGHIPGAHHLSRVRP
jgi:hypothetical protein